MKQSEHVHGEECRHCGHSETATVDALVKGYGATSTVAIVECQSCGQLWGEERDFHGVFGE